MKYERLAAYILEHVGGKENIVSANYCMTRLRLKLSDPNKADRKALEADHEIISTQEAEGKLQIIIGTHVAEVYEDLMRLTGAKKTQPAEKEKDSLLNRFASTITKIVVPSLGVLCACGIIAGLNSVLLSAHWITAESGTSILLNGKCMFDFFSGYFGIYKCRRFWYGSVCRHDFRCRSDIPEDCGSDECG